MFLPKVILPFTLSIPSCFSLRLYSRSLPPSPHVFSLRLYSRSLPTSPHVFSLRLYSRSLSPSPHVFSLRLYSRYLTWKNRLPHPAYEDPSPERFHELCVRAVEVYTKCFQERSPRQCAYDGTLYTQVVHSTHFGIQWSLFKIGAYWSGLADWRSKNVQ